MGLFFNKERIKREVSNVVGSVVLKIKENTEKTLQWIHYLHGKQQEQETRIRQLEQNKLSDNDMYKMNYVFKKVRNIENEGFSGAERKKLDYVYSRITDLDSKGVSLEEKQKMNHMFDNYGLVINKLTDIDGRMKAHEELLKKVHELEEKIATQQIVMKRPETAKDKLIKKVSQNSKEYIKKAILSLIKKYEKISGTQVKEIIVDEQNLCSRSSFYRLLDEIEKEQLIKSERIGRDKNYVPIKILR